MKITVIGHLCLDVIQHSDGNETQSYGGIFFSVAALANLLSPHDTIQPVFGVGKGEYDALIHRLKVYPNVDPTGIYKFNGPTNQVRLIYKNSKDRIECSHHIAEPIPLKRIDPYLDTDMILLNMISGFDVSLETLDEIRMYVRENQTPIYMDVHSLTLGVSEDFTRFYRPIEAWRRWLFMIHATQMNEEEAAALTTEKFDETTLAKHALGLDTKLLIITRGEHGCTVFRADQKRVNRMDIPGLKVHGTIDPTGCGDVFSAAYCAHHMKTHDSSTSVQFANHVAAFKAQLAGSKKIDRLSSFRLHKFHPEEILS